MIILEIFKVQFGGMNWFSLFMIMIFFSNFSLFLLVYSEDPFMILSRYLSKFFLVYPPKNAYELKIVYKSFNINYRTLNIYKLSLYK